MTQLRTGPVFSLGERDSEADRIELREELIYIERDLPRRRAQLVLWEHRAALARAGLDMPDDVRRHTLELAAFYEYFVRSGERLRRFLLAELSSWPDYQPAYHHVN